MKNRDGCRDLREEFKIKRFGLDHENPSLFIKSQWFRPKIYVFWVVFWMLFYTCTLCLDIYYYPELKGKYFIYFTNWSYLLQAAYVYIDFGVTIFTNVRRKNIRDGLATGTEWYIKVVWVLFNINNAISLFISAFYYSFLEHKFTHGSINKHLLNTIYTLINLIFCAKPMQILHIYQPVIYGLIYLLFSFVYNILGYAPIYTVLDWSKTGKALMVSCLSLFIGIPLMYLVCFSIQTLRIYISMKLDCLAQPEFDKRQKRDISANDEQLKDTPKPNQVYTINLSNIV